MSELAKMLRAERRRHFATSFGLLSAAIVAGTMVTNERGIFSTVLGGGPLSALERAFVAMADNDRHVPLLFNHSASSQERDGLNGADGDEPFDVLGAPADLRRRLMEALGGDADPEAVAESQNQLPSILNQQITPDQIAAGDGVPTALSSSDVGSTTPSITNAVQPNNGPGVAATPGPVLPGQAIQPDAGAGDGGGTVGAVPEPAMWALMIGGFGLVGLLQRRIAVIRRRRAFIGAEID